MPGKGPPPKPKSKGGSKKRPPPSVTPVKEPEIPSDPPVPESSANDTISRFSDLFSAAASTGLGAITKWGGPLSAGYAVMQGMDIGTDLLTEYLTGNKAAQLKLARDQMESERASRKELVDFYKGESAYDRAMEESDRSFSRAGVTAQMGLGIRDAARGDEEGAMAQGLDRIRSAYQQPPDIMGPIMMEIAQQQAAGVPPNPLLLMGLMP